MVRLGEMATDRITGFSGVVMAKIEYVNGCVQYELQPKGLHEGKPIKAEWFDEYRLVEQETKRESAAVGDGSGTATGGSGHVPPQPSTP